MELHEGDSKSAAHPASKSSGKAPKVVLQADYVREITTSNATTNTAMRVTYLCLKRAGRPSRNNKTGTARLGLRWL